MQARVLITSASHTNKRGPGNLDILHMLYFTRTGFFNNLAKNGQEFEIAYPWPPLTMFDHV